jgi:hypothetical protein
MLRLFIIVAFIFYAANALAAMRLLPKTMMFGRKCMALESIVMMHLK